MADKTCFEICPRLLAASENERKSHSKPDLKATKLILYVHFI